MSYFHCHCLWAIMIQYTNKATPITMWSLPHNTMNRKPETRWWRRHNIASSTHWHRSDPCRAATLQTYPLLGTSDTHLVKVECLWYSPGPVTLREKMECCGLCPRPVRPRAGVERSWGQWHWWWRWNINASACDQWHSVNGGVLMHLLETHNAQGEFGMLNHLPGNGEKLGNCENCCLCCKTSDT